MEIIRKNYDGDSSSDRKVKARPGRWKPVASRADMKITPEFQAEPGGRGFSLRSAMSKL